MSSTAASANPLVRVEAARVDRAGQSILQDINWQILPGEHWVIVGPNGAGKTTLARLLTGRDYLSAGTIEVLGEDLDQHSAQDLASRVGFASVEVGQRLGVQDSVLEVVLSSAWGQSTSFGEEYEAPDRERAADLLAALGVGALADRSFASLSEGERRRVLLARALMADPEILILDEPTAGLDLGGREILLTALTEIMGAPTAPTTIMITHELEEIGPKFTHALLLRAGQVVGAGPIAEMLTGPNLSTAFDLSLQVSQDQGRWRAIAAGQ